MNKYKQHFLKVYGKSEVRYQTFPHHVDIVAKWVEKLCDMHPEADREAALVAAWFHDLGHFIDEGNDHAVTSEKEAIDFLKKDGANSEFVKKVAHAVRAHRNKDVKPDTIEAKIVCCADSASHLTADVYMNVLADYGKDTVMGKLERDYRDLEDFPGIKKELTPIYLAWKAVIEAFPEDFTKYLHN
ncbi:MAG: HD domain-containing protein [bacterium]